MGACQARVLNGQDAHPAKITASWRRAVRRTAAEQISAKWGAGAKFSAPDRARRARACGTIGRMPMPDRPWADTDAGGSGDLSFRRDYPARSADLAERLSRLSAGHPSADLADCDDAWDDEPDPGSAGPDNAVGDAGAGAAGPHGWLPRHAADTGTGNELGGPAARSPYRPWFGADGASDPWFAAGLTD